MIQYLVILLDYTSTSFCHYSVPQNKQELIPLNVLKKGILFAMQEDLSVQFVYPDYALPQKYLDIIDTVDHYNIMPSSYLSKDADAIVEKDWDIKNEPLLQVPLIIRSGKLNFFENYVKLEKLLKIVPRIDIVITDIDSFTEDDFSKYQDALENLSKLIVQMFVDGLSPQLNILTDRMMLKEMRNCGAGDTTITLAPNGCFYICPAFFYEDKNDNIGNLADGVNIRNKQLYKLDHAPICRHCDSWQCKRCVWLNRKTTLEVNTPSHEQCVIAHIERNASGRLLQEIREHGSFLPEFDDIKELDYLDPFEKRQEWK